MIEGVTLTPLKQIRDDRGKVMHMLRADSDIFKKFGEVYFSTTHPGAIKAWHLHKEMTLNYAVILGEIKFVLYDDREESSTKGQVQEIYVSPQNYILVTVPPLIWNGFKTVGDTTAYVANCSTLPHSDNEIIRKDPFDKSIPYNWDIKHQ
jgi:dTDP-4-dehydrorhamnose 3,5-epimerase